jgi:hypothetical protein
MASEFGRECDYVAQLSRKFDAFDEFGTDFRLVACLSLVMTFLRNFRQTCQTCQKLEGIKS